jgi:outer membrane protein
MLRNVSALALAFLFTLTYSLADPASAQEGKIGYVDSQRIFAESKDFADAQAKFDKDIAAWNKQAEEMQAEIEDLDQELKAQSLMLSKEKREEKERSLQAKKDAYQQYVEGTFGPGGKAERRNAELIKPIRDKIISIVEKVAIEENYAMVMDASTTSIAYAKRSLDLTERIIEELKRQE